MTSLLRTHFGTDQLISSWLFFVSNIVYVVACILPFFRVFQTPHATAVPGSLGYDIIILISSIVYLVSSYNFVIISYPQNIEKFMTSLATMDIEKVDFIERYFGANSFLRPFSMMFLGSSILILYPIYGIIVGEISVANFFIFLTLILGFIWFFYLWVTSYRNMLNNNGVSGTEVYNCLLGFGVGSCFGKDILIAHFASDVVAYTWIFALISTILLIGCCVLLVIRSDTLTNLSFISCLLLSIGSYYMVYTSYEVNTFSSTFYDNFLVHFESKDTASIINCADTIHGKTGYNSINIDGEVSSRIKKSSCRCYVIS